ncbi:hypothetical protein, partial [Escherichia coli]|uniref:hypothetical protein n=1 Tax=Escherichia coli TaxID=562 RepID=UPI00390C945E
MEGDSVTLNPRLIQEHAFNSIKWWFGDYYSAVIAETDGNEISHLNDKNFRDRLELNQTGSLTIKNMRTKHSGLY